MVAAAVVVIVAINVSVVVVVAVVICSIDDVAVVVVVAVVIVLAVVSAVVVICSVDDAVIILAVPVIIINGSCSPNFISTLDSWSTRTSFTGINRRITISGGGIRALLPHPSISNGNTKVCCALL